MVIFGRLLRLKIVNRIDDNLKNKYRKIDFSFPSAHCANFHVYMATSELGEGSAYRYLGKTQYML